MSANVLKAIAVTAELTGTELSATAMRVMEADLEGFPEAAVIRALTRCRKELTGRLVLAAILDRMNDSDGRPSADEAWALALDASNEADTVIWTDEAMLAFAIARPVLACGDKVGARMAFRGAYERVVRENREAGICAKWSASLGWDKDRRTTALKRAEVAGLLPASVVSGLLPVATGGLLEQALFGKKSLTDSTVKDSADVFVRCEKLKAMLAIPAVAE